MFRKYQKLPKLRKGAWFYKVRGSYLPATWQAWLSYIPFTIFLITVLTAAIRNNHSVSDVFYAIFPQWIAAAVVITWFASKKS